MKKGVFIIFLAWMMLNCHRPAGTTHSLDDSTNVDPTLGWADPCIAGYECNFMYRDEIKQAVDLVNLITALPKEKQLAVSIFEYDQEKVQQSIPVYVASRVNNPPCEVPYKARAIVIDEHFRQILYQLFLKGGLIESIDLINPIDILTVLLLHEMGHIENKDYVKDIEYLAVNIPNDEKTQMKDIESEADEYAVRMLRDATRDTQNSQRAAIARHLLSTLGFAQLNMSFIRQKNTKGLTTDALTYYLDKGYTHQNTEYRLMVILHETTMGFGSYITDFTTLKNKLMALQADSSQRR